MTKQLELLREIAKGLREVPSGVYSSPGLLAWAMQMLTVHGFDEIKAGINQADTVKKQLDQAFVLVEKALTHREELEALPFFTTKQAAEYLNLSVSTVHYHSIYSKFLRGELVNPRMRIFYKEELDQFLAADYKRGPQQERPSDGKIKQTYKKPRTK